MPKLTIRVHEHNWLTSDDWRQCQLCGEQEKQVDGEWAILGKRLSTASGAALVR